MNKKFQKIVSFVAGFLLFISLLTVGISYRAMKKALSRVTYPPHLKERIAQNKAHLVKDLQAQKVSFKTADGLTIHGYLLVREHAKRNVLICHGYGSAKELVAEFADMLPNDNILFFDFRAHGQSEGDLITIGYDERKDVWAAVQFLQADSRTKNLPIVGIGISMGAVALLGAAAENQPFKALVIDSAFARLVDQVALSFKRRTGLPRYPFFPITKKIFEYQTRIPVEDVDAVAYLRQINVPILFVHSRTDEEIPLENTYELYRAAHEPKYLWLVEDCPHGIICRNYLKEYAERIKNFFVG